LGEGGENHKEKKKAGSATAGRIKRDETRKHTRPSNLERAEAFLSNPKSPTLRGNLGKPLSD